MKGILVLLAVPLLAADPMAILNETAETYRNLERFHFKIELTRESECELDYARMKSEYTFALDGPDRVHEEVREPIGSSVTVSDGQSLWDYRPGWDQYAAAEAESPVFPNTPDAARRRRTCSRMWSFVRDQMVWIADQVEAAELVREEPVTVGGESIDCYVVRARYQPHRKRLPYTEETVTYWIDKSRMIVLREECVARGRLRPTQPKMLCDHRHTRTMKLARINESPRDALFRFTPPPDAVEVDRIVNSGYRANLTGRPAPLLEATSIAGEPVSLTGLRGQPVLLHFWAAWCAPCRAQTPLLRRIHNAAGDRLAMLGVNADPDAEIASSYLEENDLAWTMVHDGDRKFDRPFRVTSVPVVFVIDKGGTVVEHVIGHGPSTETRLRDALEKLEIVADY